MRGNRNTILAMMPSADPIPSPGDSLAEIIGRLARGQGLSESRLEGVRFMRATRSTPRAPIVYDPSIVIVAQGRKRGYLGSEVFTYDAEHYLVLSVPLPFECEVEASVEEPMLGLSIRVEPALVADLLVAMHGAIPGVPTAEVPRGIYATPLDAGLRDAATRLAACLASEADARILGPGLVREITYRVLRGERSATLRALAAQDGHFGQIARALRRIHADYAQALRVEDLARHAGMSVSNFHLKFKAATSTPPLDYVKTIRLHKARLLMVHEGVGASPAASRVGYASASQFSREFKRLFGSTPAVEAARLRAAL